MVMEQSSPPVEIPSWVKAAQKETPRLSVRSRSGGSGNKTLLYSPLSTSPGKNLDFAQLPQKGSSSGENGEVVLTTDDLAPCKPDGTDPSLPGGTDGPGSVDNEWYGWVRPNGPPKNQKMTNWVAERVQKVDTIMIKLEAPPAEPHYMVTPTVENRKNLSNAVSHKALQQALKAEDGTVVPRAPTSNPVSISSFPVPPTPPPSELPTPQPTASGVPSSQNGPKRNEGLQTTQKLIKTLKERISSLEARAVADSKQWLKLVQEAQQHGKRLAREVVAARQEARAARRAQREAEAAARRAGDEEASRRRGLEELLAQQEEELARLGGELERARRRGFRPTVLPAAIPEGDEEGNESSPTHDAAAAAAAAQGGQAAGRGGHEGGPGGGWEDDLDSTLELHVQAVQSAILQAGGVPPPPPRRAAAAAAAAAAPTKARGPTDCSVAGANQSEAAAAAAPAVGGHGPEEGEGEAARLRAERGRLEGEVARLEEERDRLEVDVLEALALGEEEKEVYREKHQQNEEEIYQLTQLLEEQTKIVEMQKEESSQSMTYLTGIIEEFQNQVCSLQVECAELRNENRDLSRSLRASREHSVELSATLGHVAGLARSPPAATPGAARRHAPGAAEGAGPLLPFPADASPAGQQRSPAAPPPATSPGGPLLGVGAASAAVPASPGGGRGAAGEEEEGGEAGGRGARPPLPRPGGGGARARSNSAGRLRAPAAAGKRAAAPTAAPVPPAGADDPLSLYLGEEGPSVILTEEDVEGRESSPVLMRTRADLSSAFPPEQLQHSSTPLGSPPQHVPSPPGRATLSYAERGGVAISPAQQQLLPSQERQQQTALPQEGHKTMPPPSPMGDIGEFQDPWFQS